MIDYLLYGSWSCTHPDKPRTVSAIFASAIPFDPPIGMAITVCDQIRVPPITITDVAWNHAKKLLEIQASFSSPEDFVPGVIDCFERSDISYAVEG